MFCGSLGLLEQRPPSLWSYMEHDLAQDSSSQILSEEVSGGASVEIGCCLVRNESEGT